MVTRKPWYKTIHFFTTMTISRNHWIWPLIMRVSWWVPLKRPPKWHWIAGIYGPNGLVLILEKIRNLGPNRTRTKKIFKFLDRTGPGARKIFKSRTKTTKILKSSDPCLRVRFKSSQQVSVAQHDSASTIVNYITKPSKNIRVYVRTCTITSSIISMCKTLSD